MRAVDARFPALDHPASVTLSDGRVINVVVIARVSTGWIVTHDEIVMTLIDGTYRELQIDLSTSALDARLEKLRARIAALESPAGR